MTAAAHKVNLSPQSNFAIYAGSVKDQYFLTFMPLELAKDVGPASSTSIPEMIDSGGTTLLFADLLTLRLVLRAMTALTAQAYKNEMEEAGLAASPTEVMH